MILVFLDSGALVNTRGNVTSAGWQVTLCDGLPFSTKPNETERNRAIIVDYCVTKMYQIAI